MNTKFPWWKFIAGYLFFLVSHEIYKWTGGNLFGILLGEKFESVYTHMKMLFLAYLGVSLIDVFIRRKVTGWQPFLYSRLLLLSAVPWMMIAMFYAPQAVGFPVEGTTELIWGIIMTGVGLYFCRVTVEAHGGRIWVVNQPEGGACFTVCLPTTGRWREQSGSNT